MAVVDELTPAVRRNIPWYLMAFEAGDPINPTLCVLAVRSLLKPCIARLLETFSGVVSAAALSQRALSPPPEPVNDEGCARSIAPQASRPS